MNSPGRRSRRGSRPTGRGDIHQNSRDGSFSGTGHNREGSMTKKPSQKRQQKKKKSKSLFGKAISGKSQASFL